MILDNYTEISETNYLNDNLHLSLENKFLLDNPAEKLPFLVGPDSTILHGPHLPFKLHASLKSHYLLTSFYLKVIFSNNARANTQ